MNFKYTICLSVSLLMMAVALPGFSGSSRGNADLCDSGIIGQIQQGKSTKEDVKQLIGEPDKVEGALNQGELWKYSRQVTMPTGSSSVSAFTSSSKGKRGSGGVSMDKKNCNVYVYFEKNGIVRKVRESKVSGGTGFMN
jgi:outer membrane protein assembly factor BamE (lipoprotein component of BamABCDE complex)